MNHIISRFMQIFCLFMLVLVSACNQQQPDTSKEKTQGSAVQQTSEVSLDHSTESVEDNTVSETHDQPQQASGSGIKSDNTIAQAFPELKAYILKDLDIGLDEHITIYFNPENSQKVSEKHPQSEQINDEGINIKRALRGELLGKGKGQFIVDCDSGLSADPSCTILKENMDGTTHDVGQMSGLNFIMPGNGYIYVTGHTNNMFNERKKYEWKNNRFSEVTQSSYYVGLESHTTKAIVLVESKNSSKVIASLPANAPVTVLINEGDYYLIKTPFGLTGWLKLDIANGMLENTPVKDLYFRGD